MDLNSPSVTDDQIQGSQFLVGRMDELLAELRTAEVPRNPDQLVIYTRVLLQEIGQGFGILLLFGQIADGNLGTLPGNGDCSIGGQLSRAGLEPRDRGGMEQHLPIGGLTRSKTAMNRANVNITGREKRYLGAAY